MNLRRKTILTVAVSMLLLLIGLVGFSQFLVLDNLKKIQLEQTKKDVSSVEKIVDNHLAEIDKTALSWAAWDDAYSYIESPNRRFESSNMTKEVLSDLKIDAIYYFDTQKNEIGRISNDQKLTDAVVKKYFTGRKIPVQFGRKFTKKNGILEIKQQLFMFSAHGVTDTKRTLDSNGAILVLKKIDAPLLAHFSNLTGNELFLKPLDRHESRNLNINAKYAYEIKKYELTNSEKNPKAVRAKIYYYDILMNPIFYIGMDLDQEIIAKGQAGLLKIEIFLTISLFVFAIFSIKQLDKFILKRIHLMSNEVSNIENGNLQKLSVRGHDELSILAEKINELQASNQAKNTELHELNQLIVQQQESLIKSAKLSALGTMAATIAHEINNPLMIIQTRTKSIEREINVKSDLDLEKIRTALSGIISTVGKVSKTIHSLKNFSRNSDHDQFENHNLIELIQDSVEICSQKLNRNSVSIKYDRNINAKIYCKPTEIVQILVNLIGNSVDAVKNNDEKWVQIDVDQSCDQLRISVTDSGPGIPQMIREKIMQPFFTTKSYGSGTGLGLSIVRQLVEKHQGQFKLDERCKNTKFIIEFPVAASATA